MELVTANIFARIAALGLASPQSKVRILLVVLLSHAHIVRLPLPELTARALVQASTSTIAVRGLRRHPTAYWLRKCCLDRREI
jgi:hypothetical protein